MKRILGSSIALATALVALPDSASAQFATETRLRFGRHADIEPILQPQQDAIMNVATAALVTDHGSNDVACNLLMSRLGLSNVFTGGSHIINTQADYQGVQSVVSVYVAFVQAINWCGVTGTWGGCASTGSRNPVVITRNLGLAAQAGIAVAHEFGHTQGLSHDNTGLQIMDPDVLTVADRKVRTTAFCNTYRAPYTATCPPAVNGTLPGVCSPATGALTAPITGSAPVLPELPEAFAAVNAKDFTGIPIEDLALNVFLDLNQVQPGSLFWEFS